MIWAQAHGPLPSVASLRETSIVFATLIGIVVFKEANRARRIGGAVVVVSGIVLLHASRGG